MSDADDPFGPESVRFVWDEPKNRANIAKHGIDFADAYHAFKHDMLVLSDNREDYGEQQWIGLGFLDGRLVVIIFTEPRSDTIRIISLRKATRHERDRFRRTIENQLGQG